jgi:hypothetical protein
MNDTTVHRPSGSVTNLRDVDLVRLVPIHAVPIR